MQIEKVIERVNKEFASSNPKVAALDAIICEELSKDSIGADPPNYQHVVDAEEGIFKVGPKFVGWTINKGKTGAFINTSNPKDEFQGAVLVLRAAGYVPTNKGKMMGANTTILIFRNPAYTCHKYTLERTNYTRNGIKGARMIIEVKSSSPKHGY